MPTRLWPLLSPSPAPADSEGERPSAGSGFLLIETNGLRAARLLAALHAPCRLMRDGNEAIAYLLGISRYADRTAYPLPQAILLDLEYPGSPAMDLFHRSILSPALRLIPMIVLKRSFTSEELQDAYLQGAVSCLEFPADDGTAARVADGLRRYWLDCNLSPPLAKKKRNGA